MRSLAEELKIEANHADHMTGMARYWMERAQNAEKMIALVILSVGGEVVVRMDKLLDIDEVELIREDDPSLVNGLRYRVRPKPHPMEEAGIASLHKGSFGGSL